MFIDHYACVKCCASLTVFCLEVRIFNFYRPYLPCVNNRCTQVDFYFLIPNISLKNLICLCRTLVISTFYLVPDKVDITRVDCICEQMYIKKTVKASVEHIYNGYCYKLAPLYMVIEQTAMKSWLSNNALHSALHTYMLFILPTRSLCACF